MEKFLEPDFIKFFIPLAGAVLAWFINEYRKQKAEEYLRKEARYLELLKALKGFYVSASSDIESSMLLKRQFIDQLEQCWLYCPNGVIKKGYAFLELVKLKTPKEENEKEIALGEFIIEIRKDLLSHGFRRGSKLNSKDFKIYYVT